MRAILHHLDRHQPSLHYRRRLRAQALDHDAHQVWIWLLKGGVWMIRPINELVVWVCGRVEMWGHICHSLCHTSLMNHAFRAKLEGLVKDLLERTKQPCHQCMKDAGVTPKDIQEV